MKKGDIVAKEITMEVGEHLIGNLSTTLCADTWIKANAMKLYGKMPKYKFIGDEENPGTLKAVVAEAFIYTQKAIVGWIVENEVAITDIGGETDGLSRVIDLNKEPGWKVIQEAAPTYQSTVAQMSEEELRGAIDVLRRTRTVPVKITRKVRSEPVSTDPMAIALAKMNPEDKMRLMKKLGMIE